MATIRERLIYAIEVVGDGARKGITGLRQSVAEADGAFGKFKAGANSAMASVGASAGTLALAGGAALAAFGAKAVNASQETALAAGKLADATGLTVEQASRLREVGADLGVSGETITSVVKKMAVEIGKGNPLLEQYGIALQRTSDGAADVNATLLDTIRRIGQIESPTERAAAAQAAFGRGYTEAAELIFSSADRLQQKLAEVSDAKVINEAELARARHFRDSMEDLKDVTEDLTVAAGQLLVPALDAVAEQLGVVAAGAKEAGDAMEKIPGVPDFIKFAAQNLNPLGQQVRVYQALGDGVEFLTDKWEGAAPVNDRFTDSVLRGGDAASDVTPEIAALGEEVEGLGPRWSAASIPLEGASGAFAEMGVDAEAAAEALEETADSANSVTEAFGPMVEKVDFLAEALNGVSEALDMQDLMDDITDQFGEIAEAQQKIGEDGEEGVRRYDRAVRDLQRLLLRLTEDIDSIPASKKVEFIAAIQRGGVDELYRILGQLASGVTVPVSFTTPQSTGSANGVFTPGVPPPAPVFTQTAIPSGPYPVDARTINVYNPVGSTPTTIYQDLGTDFRRNGIR